MQPHDETVIATLLALNCTLVIVDGLDRREDH